MVFQNRVTFILLVPILGHALGVYHDRLHACELIACIVQLLHVLHFVTTYTRTNNPLHSYNSATHAVWTVYYLMMKIQED